MRRPASHKKSTTAGRKRIQLHIKADPGSEVYVSDSFNNWNENAKKMVDRNNVGEYRATLYLPPGKHEYKFIINGEWHVDPECPNWAVNDCGTLNSVLVVNG